MQTMKTNFLVLSMIVMATQSCGLKAGFPEQGTEETQAGLSAPSPSDSGAMPAAPSEMPEAGTLGAERPSARPIRPGTQLEKAQIEMTIETSTDQVDAEGKELEPTKLEFVDGKDEIEITCEISKDPLDLKDSTKTPLEFRVTKGKKDTLVKILAFQNNETKLLEENASFALKTETLDLKTGEPESAEFEKNNCQISINPKSEPGQINAKLKCILGDGLVTIPEGELSCPVPQADLL
jgi:hypothetical protein